MSHHDDHDERSFFQRYGVAMGAGFIVVIAVVVLAKQIFSGRSAPPRREQEITMVKLALPPPPPPPPPPPQQTPPEEKMIDQTPVAEPEPKPDEKPAPPSPSLGTNIKGDGPADGFGLSGSNGNGLLGGGTKGGGSRWGWYASEVQTKIREALLKNPHTRDIAFQGQIRVRFDATGRVVHVSLQGSADPADKEALSDEILADVQSDEPPPQGMPMPLVIRLTMQRPN